MELTIRRFESASRTRLQRRSSERRVAFYSHDTQGLGHVRRNSLLAAALVDADPGVTALLLSGVGEADALPLPPRTDLVTFPALAKDVRGSYSARSSDCSLERVLEVRSLALERALSTFAPDLLVVDKTPRGVLGELDGVLHRVRREHGTRMVLGLRDVLDDPATTRREWRAARATEAIRWLYDQVWVYGDPGVFDPAVAYGWPPAVRAKVRYTGYLGTGRSRLLPVHERSHGAPPVHHELDEPFVLCLVGGGQDGGVVADAFSRAAFPPGHQGVLVTGPFLPDSQLAAVEQLGRERPDLRVYRFVGDVPALARAARATVSMGGYNSVCELLAAGRPALVVPRTVPRREQAVRADHLARRGLVDVLATDAVSPWAFSRWLSRAVLARWGTFGHVDLRGLDRVPALAGDLMQGLPGGAEDAG